MATKVQDVLPTIHTSNQNALQPQDSDVKKQAEYQDNDELENIDVSQPSFSYEKDFCFKVALVIAPEYTHSQKIKQLIQDIIQTKKKKELISFTIQLYNQVYKNNMLKTQMQAVFLRYQQQAEHLGYQNRHAIETNCIKVFEKIPPAQELISHIHKEFLSIFREINDQAFSVFVDHFLKGSFINSVQNSALFLLRNPEKLSAEGESFQDEDIASAAQHIIYAIESIRDALKIIFKQRQYVILTEPTKKEDNKQKSAPKDIDSDLNPFFSAYLKEILRDRTNVEAGAEKESLVKDQLIRIPHLIQAMKKISDSTQQQTTNTELTRSALSIVQYLEPPSEHNTNREYEFTTDRMLLVSSKFRRKCCNFTKYEAFAALLDRVPLVESLNDAGAIRASLLKFFRLYPGVTELVGPYLIYVELGTGILGAITATDGILNPRKNRCMVRFWKASTNGVVFFVFSLGAAINIFLWKNPHQQNISDEFFYKEIASVPMTLMLLHSIWYTITPLQKEIFFPRGTCRHGLRLFFDIGSKSLYNAGVFLFATLTIHNLPKTLLSQLFPLIPGFIVSLGQTFGSFREKLNSLMTYLTFTVFTSNVIMSSLSNSPEDRSLESNSQLITRIVFLSGLGVYSFALLANQYLIFLNEYINEDIEAAQIMARRVQLKMVNGLPDFTEFQEQGTIIDMEDYRRLEEDMTQGKTKEAQTKVLLFSKKAKQQNGVINQNGVKVDEKLLAASHPFSENKIPDNAAKADDEPEIQESSKSSRCGRCTIL